MHKKKKVIIIAGIIIAVVLIAVAVLFLLLRSGSTSSGEAAAYVSSVKEITSQGSAGMINRFTGVVEPQETLDIEKSSEKTVKEILVNEGDSVTVGTPLFSYDTDEINLKLSQAQLDLEGFVNEINSLYTQIASLEKEKRSAPADEQLSYTTQIQEKQNDVRRAEYNKKSKEVEIEQIKKSLNNATVTCEIEGVVKSINQNGEVDNMTGNQLPFMTILATGNYRIKGKINETNAWTINEGAPVIIRSRIDETATWTGTITKIDFENQITNNNNYYYMDGGNGEQSTNYPFYIELATSSGLMLGQHVFIELDNGQTEEKEGLWLTESYLVTEDNDTYVWVKNDKDRLEKRSVQIGDYDSDLMEYQILSGLNDTDCIAWPTGILKEGMPCIVSSVSDMIQRNMEAEMNQNIDDGSMDGMDNAGDMGDMNGMDEAGDMGGMDGDMGNMDDAGDMSGMDSAGDMNNIDGNGSMDAGGTSDGSDISVEENK